MCDSQQRNLVGTGNSDCLSFLINCKILLWLLLMTWHGQLKKLSRRDIPNLLWGRLAQKRFEAQNIWIRQTSFFNPSVSLESSIPKGWEHLSLCLVTVFIFYFQKLVFENIKKKQFSYIFEIKNMFG